MKSLLRLGAKLVVTFNMFKELLDENQFFVWTKLKKDINDVVCTRMC
jgi:hypothetical protein